MDNVVSLDDRRKLNAPNKEKSRLWAWTRNVKKGFDPIGWWDVFLSVENVPYFYLGETLFCDDCCRCDLSLLHTNDLRDLEIIGSPCKLHTPLFAVPFDMGDVMDNCNGYYRHFCPDYYTKGKGL